MPMRGQGNWRRTGGRIALLLAPLHCLPTTIAADPEDSLRIVREDEARRVRTFAQAARSVVCIFDNPARAGGGSGVVIDPEGYGLTNFHVIASMLEDRRGYGGLADGELYPLRVLGVDPGGDIAMFKLEGRERFDFAPLADSDELRVGQWVAAMGNPFLLAEDFTPTITIGVISGLHRYQYGEGNLLEYADCIHVSTSINPGNSGGPLFDMNGRVIGINGRGSFEERGRVNVGLGYAVSINQIERFLPGLRAGQLVEHGTLGITVQTAGSELIVNAIQEFSPAHRAGLRLGDPLLSVGGRPVKTPNDFNNAIAILPANWPVKLKVRRDGQEFEAAGRLERLPVKLEQAFVPDIAHNHEEIQKLFRRYEEGDRQSAQAPPRAEWSGQIQLRDAANVSTDRFAMRQADGRARVDLASEHRAKTLEFDLADVAATTGSRAELESPAFWREWCELAAPLLVRPTLTLEWELIGGDEVGGRVVCVVQRRISPDEVYRWKFDQRTAELLQLTAGTAASPEAAVWDVEGRIRIGGLRWPEQWRRRDSAGDELIMTLEQPDARVGAALPGGPVTP